MYSDWAEDFIGQISCFVTNKKLKWESPQDKMLPADEVKPGFKQKIKEMTAEYLQVINGIK